MTSAGRTGGAPALVALPIRAPTPRTLMALAAAALAALAVAAVAYWPHPAPTPRRPHEPIAHRMTVEQYAQALWNQSHPPLLRDGPLSQNGVVATPGLAPGGRALTPAQALALNAAIPFSAAPNPPAAPFRLAAGAEDRQRALTCLTQAVYYEAGFQPLAGEEAVAQVVLNRLRHPAFPKTVCGVVYDGSQRPTGCQFTFTCDGSLAKTPVAWAWKRAEEVAQRALAGHVQSLVGDATHYHTQWVAPYWSPYLVKVAQIGAHIFYRWPGGAGGPGAFTGRYAGGERTPGAAILATAAADAEAAKLLASAPAGPLGPIIEREPPQITPDTPSASRLARNAVALLTGAPPASAAEAAAPASAPDAERAAPTSADHAPITASW